MKTMIQKARSGFTLVELLVVMLILTILSVSLLPMFKESICRAQYSADAIPVIGTLRTRIGLYQYEHAKLPDNIVPEAAEGGGVDEGEGTTRYVSSWEFVDSDNERYVTAYYKLGDTSMTVTTVSGDDSKLASTGKVRIDYNDAETTISSSGLHFGYSSVLDVDYQDLRGRSSRPIDYVYYQIPVLDSEGKKSQTDSAYVIGCFGAGYGGLAAGTGYAVCEINLVSKEKKYVGIFERYKAKKHDDVAESGEAESETAQSNLPYLVLGGTSKVSGDFVYCPNEITDALASETTEEGSTEKRPQIVVLMEKAGWKF